MTYDPDPTPGFMVCIIPLYPTTKLSEPAEEPTTFSEAVKAG
jgi:hypothetical protein